MQTPGLSAVLRAAVPERLPFAIRPPSEAMRNALVRVGCVPRTRTVSLSHPAGAPMMLTYDKDIKLAGPADIAVRKMSDGS